MDQESSILRVGNLARAGAVSLMLATPTCPSAFPSSEGVSETAAFVRAENEKDRRHIADSEHLGAPAYRLLADLALLAEECEMEGWAGPNSQPVLPQTVALARDIILTLPQELLMPDLSADGRGFVRLEWSSSPRRVFTIVCRPERVFHFARLNGSRTSSGTYDFVGMIPHELLIMILDVVKPR